MTSNVELELDDGEPREDPDVTVLRDFRLVAKLWRRDHGQLRPARRNAAPICDVPFADVLTFDSSQEELLTELVARSRDEETFLFKLELEGFRVVEGTVAPHLHMRRF